MLRLLLVEDHQLVAQALQASLRSEGFDVRCSEGAPDTLPSLLGEFPADVVLLDLYLAEGRSGIDLLPILRSPNRKVILVTGETDPLILARALRAGADTVVEKSVPLPELVRQVVAAVEGPGAEAEERRARIFHDARLAAAEQDRLLAPFATLTEREAAVLALLVDGVKAADIAERCYVSLSTVRAHIRSILTKLEVRSQLQAVVLAAKAGWSPGASPSSHHF